MMYWLPANSVMRQTQPWMMASVYGLVGRLVLNILSMGSGLTKPPTTLLVAATMAITPSTVANVLFFSPTRTIAPTTAIASSALVSDMSGVCRSGETWRITSKPMKAASMKTKSASIRLEGIRVLSCRFSVTSSHLNRQHRHFKKVPHPRVYNLSAVGNHRLADNLILRIQLQLAVFHHVKKKGHQVAGIHLARVIRHAAGKIDRADNDHPVCRYSLAGASEFAVSAALRRQVDNHRSGRHAFDHVFGNQHW